MVRMFESPGHGEEKHEGKDTERRTEAGRQCDEC